MSIDTLDTVVGKLDVYEEDQVCAGCNTRIDPSNLPGILYVAGCPVHDGCADTYMARIHWKKFTPEQRKKLIENSAPNVLSPAIRKFKYSRWFELKNFIAQRVWNWMRGI